MDVPVFSFQSLEMLGIVAFAISGSMMAIDKHTDLFGVIFLGVTTALGGGVTRDVIIGNIPPQMFTNYIFAAVAAGVSLLVFIAAYIAKNFYKSNRKLIKNVNNVFDAIGLGVFTVSGANVVISNGFFDNAFLVVFLGAITGIGGGLLRDLMLCQIPVVLRAKIYAVAAIFGGCVYWLLLYLDVNTAIAAFSGIFTVFAIRMLATVFKLNLPIANKEN